MSYDGGAKQRSTVEVRNNPLASRETGNPKLETRSSAATWPQRADGAPDFDQMTSEQRVAYHEARLKRAFG